MATGDRGALLGRRIREAREAMPHENGRHVSQETLAGKLNVHWVTVSSWERGKNPPNLENLMNVAEVTGRPLSFFTEAEQGDDDSDEEAASVTEVLMQALRAAVRQELRAAAREGA